MLGLVMENLYENSSYTSKTIFDKGRFRIDS